MAPQSRGNLDVQVTAKNMMIIISCYWKGWPLFHAIENDDCDDDIDLNGDKEYYLYCLLHNDEKDKKDEWRHNQVNLDVQQVTANYHVMLWWWCKWWTWWYWPWSWWRFFCSSTISFANVDEVKWDGPSFWWFIDTKVLVVYLYQNFGGL